MFCTKLIDEEYLENRKKVAANLSLLRELTKDCPDAVKVAQRMCKAVVQIQLSKISQFICEDDRDAWTMYNEYLAEMEREGREAYRIMHTKFGDKTLDKTLEHMASDNLNQKDIQEHERKLEETESGGHNTELP